MVTYKRMAAIERTLNMDVIITLGISFIGYSVAGIDFFVLHTLIYITLSLYITWMKSLQMIKLRCSESTKDKINSTGHVHIDISFIP